MQLCLHFASDNIKFRSILVAAICFVLSIWSINKGMNRDGHKMYNYNIINNNQMSLCLSHFSLLYSPPVVLAPHFNKC